MSDLILRTGLKVLSKNLERLQKLRDLLERRRGEKISSLVKCLYGDESVRSSIEKINETIHGITKRYKDLLEENSCDDDLKTLEKDEKFLFEEIQKATNILRTAKRNVEKMQDRSVSEARGLRDIACRQFETETGSCIEIVEAINDKIEHASDKERKHDSAEAERLREEAWAEYNQKLHKLSQDVFTEYVDFLRGLAMRDEGLDEGICQIVDTLISKCKIVDVDHSLSIPDRHEAVSMTLARIIRIGFPGWTIWAVPLTVHELGHIAVYGRKLQDFVSKNAGQNSIKYCLGEILSDAVATYLMGPAYACAAILMRFNPTSAYEKRDGHTADAKRAYVILDMLSWMNDQVGEHPYATIIETLKGEWNAALRQAKQPEEMEADDKKQLDAWMTHSGGRELIKSIVMGGFTVQSWRRSQQLSELLRKENIDDFRPDSTDDLVHVLNAAWLSRTFSPDKADDIEKAALSVWNEIAKRPTAGRQVPAAPSRPGG